MDDWMNSRPHWVSYALRRLLQLGALLSIVPTGASAQPLYPGDLVLVSECSGGIVRVNPVDGTFSELIPPEINTIFFPLSSAIAPDGSVFIADEASCSGCTGLVYEVDPSTGNHTPIITSERCFDDMAFDSNGQIVAVDRCVGIDGDVVDRIDPSTGIITQVAFNAWVDPNALIDWPSGIAIDSNGDYLVSDVSNDAVIRVNPTTGAQSMVSSGGMLNLPQDLTIDSNGRIVVANGFTRTLVGIDPHTGIQEIVSFDGYFEHLTGVAAEASGDLLAIDALGYSLDALGTLIRVAPDTGEQSLVNSYPEPDFGPLLPINCPSNIAVFLPEPGQVLMLASGLGFLVALRLVSLWRKGTRPASSL